MGNVRKRGRKIENKVYNIITYLKEIRKSKKLTQEDMAKRTGLTQQMISKIESCNVNPSMESFVKYCDGIGINLLELLNSYKNGG